MIVREEISVLDYSFFLKGGIYADAFVSCSLTNHMSKLI